jgi:hypothetical protein
MERQLDELVCGIAENNNIQQKILDKIGVLSTKAEGTKIEGIINRKFIVKIDVESCFKLLSDNLTRNNVNGYNRASELEYNNVHKVNHNVNLNHICICFNKKRYLEIFIIPIEKDISEIHINGINIQMDYFQNYLSLINSILEKNKKL